jgi:hypothetical protein
MRRVVNRFIGPSNTKWGRGTLGYALIHDPLKKGADKAGKQTGWQRIARFFGIERRAPGPCMR